MKKTAFFLAFILCFSSLHSLQDSNIPKKDINIVKQGQYSMRVRLVPLFRKLTLLLSEIKKIEPVEEIDIAPLVLDEIETTSAKAIRNITLTEKELIEEIKTIPIKSIEEKFINQAKTLKENKIAEIETIAKELNEKLRLILKEKQAEMKEFEEKKAGEIKESKKAFIEEKILKNENDIQNQLNEVKMSLLDLLFKRMKNIENKYEEELKSVKEKYKKKIEDIKTYKIPDLLYVEAWTINEFNSIRQKAVEEKRIGEKKYFEELEDLERKLKEFKLDATKIQEKLPVFKTSPKGEREGKVENVWLKPNEGYTEIEKRAYPLDIFELNFLTEEPLKFKIYPHFQMDYCRSEGKGISQEINFYFNMDSDGDGIADTLAVTEENELERKSFLEIQFGKRGSCRPFKIKNKRYLIERELGLKPDDNWYYDTVAASLSYDYHNDQAVIKADYEKKYFSEIILRRRFRKLDLQKYPFLSLSYDVSEGQIPRVYLGLRIDTTGNGRPNKTILSPIREASSGELIFNAYETAKKDFPHEKKYDLLEAVIHLGKTEESEGNRNSHSVICLKKFSSFNYTAPTYRNKQGKKENKRLFYLHLQGTESKEELKECNKMEIDLRNEIFAIESKELDKFTILGGKILFKDKDKKNKNILIREAYFSPPKELLEQLNLIEKRKETLQQDLLSRKKSQEKPSEKKPISEKPEMVKKEEAERPVAKEEKDDFKDLEIPCFLSEMEYSSSRYSSLFDVLKERKLFYKEIGYREQFNLSSFVKEETIQPPGETSLGRSWKITTKNCDFIPERKNNSVVFKMILLDGLSENAYLKLQKKIASDLNIFKILRIETEEIPKDAEIICTLHANIDGQKREISVNIKEGKEYYLLEEISAKKALLSEVIIILKPARKATHKKFEFKLKSLSFYSYKQGNLLSYLKNTYVKTAQPFFPIRIDSDKIDRSGTEAFSLYKENNQVLVFIFQENESGENLVKIRCFFEPPLPIKKWKKFEYEYFVDNPENLEISFQFLIDLSGDGGVDRQITFDSLLTRQNNKMQLLHSGFNLFERINSFWNCYPGAEIRGMEISIKKSSSKKAFPDDKLFLLSNLRVSKEEYKETIYDEILTLPLISMDGKEYSLNQLENLDDNWLVQAITEGHWLSFGNFQLRKGKHELVLLKHPWLKAETVEIAEK